MLTRGFHGKCRHKDGEQARANQESLRLYSIGASQCDLYSDMICQFEFQIRAENPQDVFHLKGFS